MKADEIRKQVREGYGQVATQTKQDSGCGCGPSCCGPSTAEQISKGIGYNDEDLHNVPEGANLGLGCGNPIALASLAEGETVVDLGSGAGFDCFLAAGKVGQTGKVIGVDMTHEMIEKARANADKGKQKNVEFRLGEIEHLPVADNSADIIISNCVINLSPDKQQVFSEAYRVLKPGGRVMVSDIVLLKPLPDYIMNSVRAYVGCLSGAMLKDDYLDAIKKAGFENVEVVEEKSFPIDFLANDETALKAVEEANTTFDRVAKDIGHSVLSVNVKAIK
ncbi:MAG: arsenite methyltransferase [candidate division Zixibacteria bacterium]|nr:arsenite methyltransferase [candidate division Zixibacteria bacterium]